MSVKINLPRKNILVTVLLALFVLLAIPLGWDSPYLGVRYFSVGLTAGGIVLFALWRRTISAPISVPLIVLPMSLFVIYQAGLLTITPLPPYGIDKVLVNLALLLFFVIFTDTVRQRFVAPHRWENALILSIGLVAVVEMLPILAWYLRWMRINGSLFPLPPLAYRLPGVLLVHANIVAGVVNIAFGIALVRFLRQSAWKTRSIWAIFLLFLMTVMYFSSSRGGMLGMFTEIAVIPSLFFGEHFSRILRRAKHAQWWQRYWRQLAIGTVIFGGILLLVVQRITLTPGKGAISSARTGIWRLSWQVFQTSPVWGVGTGGFDPLYVRFGQIPPGYVAPHAHNLGIQILATTGIIGALITLVGIGIGVWTLWQVVNTDVPRFAAYLGIFAAMGIHHLVDYLLWQPVYAADFLLVAALAFAATPQRTRVKIPVHIAGFMLLAGTALFLWGTMVSLRGYPRYLAGINAAKQGDIQTAQTEICAAADAFPTRTLYQFECGLAAAAIETPEMTAAAIRHLQTGWQQDPFWTVHVANIAVLQWQQKDYSAAQQTFATAVGASPKNYLYYLNMGRMAEIRGEANAMEHYQKALRYRPELADTFFMQQTSVRTEAIRRQWVARAKSRGSTTLKYAGWDALAAGEPAIAQIIFREQIRRAPNAANAYCGLAQIAAAAEQWSAADDYLKIARFIAPDAPIVAHTTAILNRARGNDVRAAATLYAFFRTTLNTPPNRVFSNAYYFAVYHRLTLPYDFVPQTRIPVLTVDMTADLRWLINFYRQNGNTEKATEIERWLTARTEN